jgi:hypothetical protein
MLIRLTRVRGGSGDVAGPPEALLQDLDLVGEQTDAEGDSR